MNGWGIVDRIGRLVNEELELYRQSQAAGGLDLEDNDRLRDIEVALDRCWALLLQRPFGQ